VVDGCYWACPYEYKFFDFSDPSKGWPELDVESDDYILMDDHKNPEFNEDGTITCYETEEFYVPLQMWDNDITLEIMKEIPDGEYDDEDNYDHPIQVKVTLKRIGNKIIVTDKWLSERRKERIKGYEKWKKKNEEWTKKFRSEDPLYLKYKEMLKKYKHFPMDDYESRGITHEDWCPDFKEKETRWCRRILKKTEENLYTVDLEWAVKTGPIKLQIFKGDKTLEDKFFEHTADDMKKAFNYTNQLFIEEN